jgi:hypothetical protein
MMLTVQWQWHYNYPGAMSQQHGYDLPAGVRIAGEVLGQLGLQLRRVFTVVQLQVPCFTYRELHLAQKA